MEDFNKVRTGIAGLKKEREDLRKNYEFLSRELNRIVDDNSGTIKQLTEKSESMATSLASMDERLGRTDSSIETARGSLTTDVMGIKRRLESHKKNLTDIGERLQKATDVADVATKRIDESRRFEKGMSKYLNDLNANLEVLEQKISSFEKSFEESLSTTDNKFVSGISLINRTSDEQSSVLKDHDSAIQRLTLSLQTLKKDLEKENERTKLARDSAEENARKLELIGKLEAKIKHIEDIKSGLVKGVESIKGIKNEMVALEQKTRDLDSKLSDADKFLESRLLEKTKMLDSQMADKTQAMEMQMEDRLKLLESNIVKRNNEVISKVNLDLAGRGKYLTAASRALSSLKTDHTSTKRKLAEIGTLQSKIKQIEEVKAGVLKEVESIKGMKNQMAVLRQKTNDLDSNLSDADKFLESKMLEKTKSMEKHMKVRLKLTESDIVKKNSDVISMVNLDMDGLANDLTTANKMISMVKADHAETKKKVSEIASLRQRIRDAEKLGKTLSENLAEIKKLHNSVVALRKDFDSNRIRMEDVDSAIDSKIDFNISTIKKDAAFNSATLARLDEGLKKFSLDVNSLKKDLGTSGTSMGKLTGKVDSLQKKVSGLEKLQVKLGEMGDAKQALTQAMEAKLEERIKFLDTNLRQKAENIEANLSEKSKVTESRMDKDISAIKSELSGKTKTIDSVKARLEKIGRLEERLKTIDRQKETITKNVSSLQAMKTGMTKMDERSKVTDRDLRALKAQVDSGLADLRGKIDTTTTEDGNKFSTAVKAFLNARADLNKKISLLDLKMQDSNKRMTDFSKVINRMDLLEKKVDRLTEKGAQIRRDMDYLENKGEPDEKVMVVDLGKGDQEV
jgi:chromosome segregation ATPase